KNAFEWRTHSIPIPEGWTLVEGPKEVESMEEDGISMSFYQVGNFRMKNEDSNRFPERTSVIYMMEFSPEDAFSKEEIVNAATETLDAMVEQQVESLDSFGMEALELSAEAPEEGAKIVRSFRLVGPYAGA